MEPDASLPDRAPSLRRDPTRAVDLLERDAELAALDALIAVSPAGVRLLAIEGPPGIGKTRLLGEARRSGSTVGMLVLAARGSELEQPFSFGVVRQLFEPLLASASAEEEADMFVGAAGLARPVFDPANLGAEPAAESSLATLHGLFWLTANLADRQALLIAIDDLHWCDPASLRWLAYVLPRIEGLPVLIVVGLRPAEPEAVDVALLAQLTTDPLATVLRPAALSQRATGRLLAELVSADVDNSFTATLHEASGGNPLLVRELANSVAAEGLAPTAENAPRLHELGGRAVSRAVVLRLSRLPVEAAALARAVAVLGDDADLGIAAALAGLDLGAASEAATRLGRIEILHEGVPLGFVHPVVRAAVYAELSPVDKSRGHMRAARLLAERDADPERVAAQLLATTAVGETWVTNALRAAGRAALARGAPESAAVYLRRALSESPGEETAEVLHELGAAEAQAASPAAFEHLSAARAGTSDPRARATIALELAGALFSTGRPPKQAVEVLDEALAGLADDDRELALELESQLVGIARLEPALYPLGVERLRRLRERSSHLTGGEHVLVLANLASEASRAGISQVEAVELAEQALAGDALMTAYFDPGFIFAVQAFVYADRFDIASRRYAEAMGDARRRGLVARFCLAACYRSAAEFRSGSLAAAVADAELALAAIDAHELELVRPYAVAFLADALMEQGKLEQAREAIDSAGLPPGTELDSYPHDWFVDSRARLQLLQGDADRALRDFVTLGDYVQSFGILNPALFAWRSNAALAALAVGRGDTARSRAAEELGLARQWGAPRTLGKSLVAAGLAEGGEDGLPLLREAVAVLEHSQARLEHARALVELGSALRRSNKRADAREPLRLGRELATLCGAAPLAQRAETELLATGARPRRIASSGAESLTPSERRVAEMAASGDTNREIAQALFVTTKTVEVHLSSVYRKLDIRSRRELPAALSHS
jgi:DNA-binding CsgD family transcriptional regulator